MLPTSSNTSATALARGYFRKDYVLFCFLPTAYPGTGRNGGSAHPSPPAGRHPLLIMYLHTIGLAWFGLGVSCLLII